MIGFCLGLLGPYFTLPVLGRLKGTDKSAGMGSPGRQRRNQRRAVGLKSRRKLHAGLAELFASASVHFSASKSASAVRSMGCGDENQHVQPSQEFASVLKAFVASSDLDAAQFFRAWSQGTPDLQTTRCRDLFPVPPLTDWPDGISTGVLCQRACLDASNLCLSGLNHLHIGMKTALTQPMRQTPSAAHREVHQHVCQRVVRFLDHLDGGNVNTLGWRSSFSECETAGHPSYEDICSGRMDLPERAGTCNPCAVIPAELRTLITDPHSVFPYVVPKEVAQESISEPQRAQYRDLVIRELRCGKLVLRDGFWDFTCFFVCCASGSSLCFI